MYNVLSGLFFIILLIIYPFMAVFSSRWRKGLPERLGFISKKKRQILSQKPCIWMHAASAGESMSLLPIVKLVSLKYGQYQIVVSTLTEAGRIVAEKNIKEAAVFFYFPYDLPWFAKRSVKIVNPKLFIMSETEIWPNVLKSIKNREGKTILINGRISNKSFPKYKLIKFFLKEIFKFIDLFSMTTEEDASRIIELGAFPEKVVVGGHSKFEVSMPKATDNGLKFLKNKKIIICGSTHQGEEEIILNVFNEISKDFPDLMLIIAPRQIERINDIIPIIQSYNISFIKKSEINTDNSDNIRVILLDTMGELSKLYNLAYITFVGGSLVPVGGHNLIEPALSGKPVLFGPNIENFQDIADELKKKGGGIEVQDAEDLKNRLIYLLKFKEECIRLGADAKKTVSMFSGSTQKNIKYVEELLSAP